MVAVSLKKVFFQAEDGIRDIAISDWSSDVCSSDLESLEAAVVCRAVADGDCSMMRSSGFSVPIPETGLVPYNGEPDIAPVNVISSAFGFGGNCVSLIFSKV